tara:strand:+ start:488 stop:1126 length:639 start_codon:yes stop_codon:yes gene_type:complete
MAIKLADLLPEVIKFKDKEAYLAYKAKHKIRPSTIVQVGGKDTTAGELDGEEKKKKPTPKKKKEKKKDKPKKDNDQGGEDFEGDGDDVETMGMGTESPEQIRKDKRYKKKKAAIEKIMGGKKKRFTYAEKKKIQDALEDDTTGHIASRAVLDIMAEKGIKRRHIKIKDDKVYMDPEISRPGEPKAEFIDALFGGDFAGMLDLMDKKVDRGAG